jgi:hypothetical protein
MKDIREVYPNCFDRYWGYPSNYQPMIDSFGYNILLAVHDRDYQGDSRYLFQNGDRYGMLIFGWGSCSGCDALQSCSSYEDVDKLRMSLYNSTQWFDNKEDCLNYFINHDWEGDYCWHMDETKFFITNAIKALQ